MEGRKGVGGSWIRAKVHLTLNVHTLLPEDDSSYLQQRGHSRGLCIKTACAVALKCQRTNELSAIFCLIFIVASSFLNV